MPVFTRFAVYYAPEPGPLADFGAAWLGWDATAGSARAHPDIAGLPRPVAEITQTPRKYGFHGTVKPPFRLAPGSTPEALAADLGMSVSSFHHRFKEATAMSPLQFHKQLRLQEARRLMLGEQLDATTAGSRVGYADMAYFNRDYKRLFGAPPIRDVHRLRQTSTETSAVNI